MKAEIITGDCLEVMGKMEDSSVQLMFMQGTMTFIAYSHKIADCVGSPRISKCDDGHFVVYNDAFICGATQGAFALSLLQYLFADSLPLGAIGSRHGTAFPRRMVNTFQAIMRPPVSGARMAAKDMFTVKIGCRPRKRFPTPLASTSNLVSAAGLGGTTRRIAFVRTKPSVIGFIGCKLFAAIRTYYCNSVRFSPSANIVTLLRAVSLGVAAVNLKRGIAYKTITCSWHNVSLLIRGIQVYNTMHLLSIGNPEYADMARRRVANAMPLFAEAK